jgi:hypothetical protein
MSMHDDEPELAGYENGDGRPLRSPRLLLVMRIFVIVGVAGLILPGIVTTVSVAASSAKEACRRWVAYADPASPGSRASFEIFGAGGMGWECYTQGAFGGDSHVASLGLIPGPPKLPARNPVNS